MRRLGFLFAALLAASPVAAQTVYISGGAWGGGGGGGGGGGLAPTGGTGYVVETAPGVTINRTPQNTDGCLVLQNASGVAADTIINADDNCLVKFSSGTGDPPATCTPPELYYETDTFELSWCSNTDTWEFIITQNAQTDDATIVGSGTGFGLKVIPDCNAATEALNYDQATNAFSCRTLSAGSAFDPSTTAEIYTEFCTDVVYTNTTTSGSIGADWNFVAVSNGDFNLGSAETAGVAEHPCVGSLEAGTDPAGSANVRSAVGWVIASGEIVFKSAFLIPALSDGTDGFRVVAGIVDSATTLASGCWVAYEDDLNSGEWQYGCSNAGGGATTVDTNVAVAANTWYEVVITINAAGTSANFTINGANSQNITDDLPAADTIRSTLSMRKTSGTGARNLNGDYIYTKATYTNRF